MRRTVDRGTKQYGGDRRQRINTALRHEHDHEAVVVLRTQASQDLQRIQHIAGVSEAPDAVTV